MIALIALLALAAAEETPFRPSAQLFADAGACRAHLETLVADSADYEIVRGPYPIAEGDIRIHRVKVEGAGHRIWEYRCLGKDLAERDWLHSMVAEEPEFTVESVARDAEWLKQGAPEQ